MCVYVYIHIYVYICNVYMYVMLFVFVFVCCMLLSFAEKQEMGDGQNGGLPRSRMAAVTRKLLVQITSGSTYIHTNICI